MTAWRVAGERRQEIHLLDWHTRERRVLLVNTPPDGDGLSWSPDGRTIAFSSWKEWGNQELYLLDVAAGRARRLTNHPSFDYGPAFSPDGRRILFLSFRTGVPTIHVGDVDGWNPVALPAIGGAPAWSPTGEQFLFSHFDEVRLHSDIYVAGANGRRQRNLTDRFGSDTHPDWFDPAFVRSVSPSGRAAVTWGSLKNSTR